MSKQLLPVFDKPMVYYPLSTLMLAGIRTILLITTPDDAPLFRRLLGDGSDFGLDVRYAVQPEPRGLAQAYTVGRAFLGGEASCLILGDNLFHGTGLVDRLRAADVSDAGATVFACHVGDPTRYGVADFDENGRLVRIVEKPRTAPSSWAITGLYFYDGSAPDVAATLQPSQRGQYEITDLSNQYLRGGKLSLERLGRGVAWLDMGTPQSLLAAGEYVRTVEERQGWKIGCPEEIAYGRGWIGPTDLERLASAHGDTAYAGYLRDLLQEGTRT